MSASREFCNSDSGILSVVLDDFQGPFQPWKTDSLKFRESKIGGG